MFHRFDPKRRQKEELTLLCVEDDPICVELIRKVLDKLFTRVVFAADGCEGLKEFVGLRPDIVLTDQMMPNLSGLGMVRQIRSFSSSTPVIMMTSAIDEQVLMEAINLGVSKFVPKPVDLSILRSALTAVKQELTAGILLEQTRRQEVELLRYWERYHVKQQEMAFRKERHIIRNDLLGAAFTGSGGGIWGLDVIYRSQDIMCGDSYTVRSLADGRQLIFLADAMGSGLSASITSMLATSHCNYLVDRLSGEEGLLVETLVRDLAAYLSTTLLDDEMLCMGVAIIDPDQEALEGAFFGLPPLLVKRKTGIIAVKGGNPPLSPYHGQIAITRITLGDVISLTIASDGLGEAEIGENGSFRDVVEERLAASPTSARFMAAFDQMAGAMDDDLVVVHLQRISQAPQWQWEASIIDPALLQVSQLLQDGLAALAGRVPLVEQEQTEIELILTEALTNALEHGCLRLDKKRKDQMIADGDYDDFLESGLAGCGTISLAIFVSEQGSCPLIRFQIADSGAGFDPAVLGGQEPEGLSGRGMRLLRKYADGVYTLPPGNCLQILKTVEVAQC